MQHSSAATRASRVATERASRRLTPHPLNRWLPALTAGWLALAGCQPVQAPESPASAEPGAATGATTERTGPQATPQAPASEGPAASGATGAADAAQADPHQAAKQSAVQSADAWLALIDSQQYDASWNAAAPVFQSTITAEQWAQAVTSAREPLGDLTSREMSAAQYQSSVPNAPPGEYVIIRYESAFANRPEAVEIVTATLAPDQTWKVAGYFIQ